MPCSTRVACCLTPLSLAFVFVLSWEQEDDLQKASLFEVQGGLLNVVELLSITVGSPASAPSEQAAAQHALLAVHDLLHRLERRQLPKDNIAQALHKVGCPHGSGRLQCCLHLHTLNGLG